MQTQYIIECNYAESAGNQSGEQWEPIPEGDYATLEEAISGMRELEENLGWRRMRIVSEADGSRKVEAYGAE